MKGSDDERSIGRVEHSSGVQVAVRHWRLTKCTKHFIGELGRRRGEALLAEEDQRVLVPFRAGFVVGVVLSAAVLRDLVERPRSILRGAARGLLVALPVLLVLRYAFYVVPTAPAAIK